MRKKVSKETTKTEEVLKETDVLEKVSKKKVSEQEKAVAPKKTRKSTRKTFANVETKNDAPKVEKEKEKVRSSKRVTINRGLSAVDVQERIEAGLVNITVNKNAKTTKQIVVSNVFTIFNLLNLFVATALIVAGSYKNLLFLAVIICNTVIGIVQEIKAKATIESLSLVSAPVVTVVRDGRKSFVKADELVVDDIVIFEAGKQIVADCVVRKGIVEVNESLLTGESESVVKKFGSLLYSGSYVVSDECYARVERVGQENYVQQLADQAKHYKKPSSEIMRALNQLIKIITLVVILSGGILFYNNYVVVGASWEEAVVATAGSMIGMIPSGLYLMTSISLAYGVIRLGQRKTLVQDLYCIEMLARVDVLCLDKTGTITDGTMRVKDVIEYEGETESSLKQIVALVLGNTKENNATAEALKKKFGMVKRATTRAIVPFSSARKYMAAYFENKKLSYLIGAPEFVLNQDYKESLVSTEVDKFARQGLRVLLVASSPTKITSPNQNFSDVKPLALITIEDVIRKDAIETIQYFKNSDVNVKVISGDNPLTASKIALRAGIENANRSISLDGMADDVVAKIAEHYTVFGRVSPKQKQILIRALKEKKHTVAMTGDGVNDILALKEADCSIAMANGSEATRNVSHLVLLDSNFSSMPAVVQEGRRVINNIQRVATMFLTKTIFSFLLTMICVIFGLIYPIQSIQLIIFDWFIISLPSLYLALEPNNTQVKGRFLFEVFLNALPGALLIVFNYGVIRLLAPAAGFSDAVISTLTVISIICVGYTVLAKVCRPYNNNRRIMYALMLVLGITMYFTLGPILLEIVDIKELGINAILLAICLGQFIYPAYSFLVKTGQVVRKGVSMKNIVNI